ncbi:MAG: S9 family peptidase [Bacteroidota bacterium]
MNPPIANKIPHLLEKHGHSRLDNYYWMRERENPAVIDYLEAENAYSASILAHTEHLQQELFEEIKSRIKKDDTSVPYRLEAFYYYHRHEEGKEYPIFCRKKESLEAEEEILLNINELAEGHNYFQVAGLKLSKDHSLMAYGVDTVGRRIYTAYVKDLRTGETLPTSIPNMTGNMVWANDNKTLFYARQDPETLRSHKIFRHILGTDPQEDVLVYEETDDTFSCYISKSKSKQYLSIGCASTLSTEVRILEADNPMGNFRVLQPREEKHEYSSSHFDGYFYLITNWEATNFRLMRTKIDQLQKEHWEEVIPHREDVLLESIDIFRDYLVLEERKDGLNHIRIIPWKEPQKEYYVDFHDPVYDAWVGYNPDIETTLMRFSYQSLTTPVSTYDMDLHSKDRSLLKQQEVLGDFEVGNYRSERLFSTAEDGTQVPMSVVYRIDQRKEGPQPLLLYSYGSYGHSMDPYFSSARLSLLDRGFIYVMAHVRGGSDLGRKWYDTGKMLHKRNTFTDFIACGEHLVKEGYTDPGQLFCMGGSAGGLLIGATINMKPELFHGAIADVPFVDVVTTMLDDEIPLTTGEYDEWGNPNEKQFYDYMLSYSPYDNVEARAYPHLLVLSGLHDSQVQYWEPTKWVAKLRELKTDHHRLLLRTNMAAGHSGASGRFEPYKEVALKYAFLLDLVEKKYT